MCTDMQRAARKMSRDTRSGRDRDELDGALITQQMELSYTGSYLFTNGDNNSQRGTAGLERGLGNRATGGGQASGSASGSTPRASLGGETALTRLPSTSRTPAHLSHLDEIFYNAYNNVYNEPESEVESEDSEEYFGTSGFHDVSGVASNHDGSGPSTERSSSDETQHQSVLPNFPFTLSTLAEDIENNDNNNNNNNNRHSRTNNNNNNNNRWDNTAFALPGQRTTNPVPNHTSENFIDGINPTTGLSLSEIPSDEEDNLMNFDHVMPNRRINDEEIRRNRIRRAERNVRDRLQGILGNNNRNNNQRDEGNNDGSNVEPFYTRNQLQVREASPVAEPSPIITDIDQTVELLRRGVVDMWDIPQTVHVPFIPSNTFIRKGRPTKIAQTERIQTLKKCNSTVASIFIERKKLLRDRIVKILKSMEIQPLSLDVMSAIQWADYIYLLIAKVRHIIYKADVQATRAYLIQEYGLKKDAYKIIKSPNPEITTPLALKTEQAMLGEIPKAHKKTLRKDLKTKKKKYSKRRKRDDAMQGELGEFLAVNPEKSKRTKVSSLCHNVHCELHERSEHRIVSCSACYQCKQITKFYDKSLESPKTPYGNIAFLEIEELVPTILKSWRRTSRHNRLKKDKNLPVRGPGRPKRTGSNNSSETESNQTTLTTTNDDYIYGFENDAFNDIMGTDDIETNGCSSGLNSQNGNGTPLGATRPASPIAGRDKLTTIEDKGSEGDDESDESDESSRSSDSDTSDESSDDSSEESDEESDEESTMDTTSSLTSSSTSHNTVSTKGKSVALIKNNPTTKEKNRTRKKRPRIEYEKSRSSKRINDKVESELLEEKRIEDLKRSLKDPLSRAKTPLDLVYLVSKGDHPEGWKFPTEFDMFNLVERNYPKNWNPKFIEPTTVPDSLKMVPPNGGLDVTMGEGVDDTQTMPTSIYPCEERANKRQNSKRKTDADEEDDGEWISESDYEFNEEPFIQKFRTLKTSSSRSSYNRRNRKYNAYFKNLKVGRMKVFDRNGKPITTISQLDRHLYHRF